MAAGVATHLRHPAGPLRPALPEEPSTTALLLALAGKSEPVWDTEMLLGGKETGQAGEWGDTEQSQGSAPAPRLVSLGAGGAGRETTRENKKRNLGGRQETQGRGPEASEGQEVGC